MIVTCGSCGKRYAFDLQKLGGRTTGRLRCPTCKASIEITAPPPSPDQTQRLEIDANLLPARAKVVKGTLFMPTDRRISLAVLQGKDTGKIFKVERPSVTMGRADADIILDDGEVSRHHACLEIHGAKVVLRDLGSTNGTFINDTKITQTELENRAEFRLGATRLMLILTDTESDMGTAG